MLTKNRNVLLTQRGDTLYVHLFKEQEIPAVAQFWRGIHVRNWCSRVNHSKTSPIWKAVFSNRQIRLMRLPSYPSYQGLTAPPNSSIVSQAQGGPIRDSAARGRVYLFHEFS